MLNMYSSADCTERTLLLQRLRAKKNEAEVKHRLNISLIVRETGVHFVNSQGHTRTARNRRQQRNESNVHDVILEDGWSPTATEASVTVATVDVDRLAVSFM